MRAVSICQGDVRNVPIEVQETNFPFIVEEFGLRADSGGSGKHRGGFGTVITYRCLQKTSANINLERIVEPPWGISRRRRRRLQCRNYPARQMAARNAATKETNIQLNAGDRVTFPDRGRRRLWRCRTPGTRGDRSRPARRADNAAGRPSGYGFAHSSEAAE